MPQTTEVRQTLFVSPSRTLHSRQVHYNSQICTGRYVPVCAYPLSNEGTSPLYLHPACQMKAYNEQHQAKSNLKDDFVIPLQFG